MELENYKDVEIFYYTVQASKRVNGTLKSPIFSLGINSTKKGIDNYDIYISPEFFGCVFSVASSQISLTNPYYEVRLTGQNIINERALSNNACVLFRGYAQYSLVNHSGNNYIFKCQNENINPTSKYIKISDSNFNFNNFTVEIVNMGNTVLDVSSNPADAQDFILKMKVLFFPK